MRGALRFARIIVVALASMAWQSPARVTTAADVSGAVVDAATGAAIPFVQVTLTLSKPYSQHRGVAADEEGQFQFDAVAPGEYFVGAFVPPYTVGYAASAEPWHPGAPIVVTAGRAVGGLQVRLVRGAVITGRITDGDGSPAASVELNLGPEKGGPVFTGPLSVTCGPMHTNVDGEYRIACLPPGRYLVSTRSSQRPMPVGSSDGPAYKFVSTFFPAATSQSDAQVLELRVGEERNDIDIRRTLTPLFSVRGVIAAPEELGSSYLGISVRRLDGPYEAMQSSSTTGSQPFVVAGLSPGRYAIRAHGGNNDWGGIVTITVLDRDLDGVSVPIERNVEVSGSVSIEGSTLQTPGGWFSVSLVPLSDVDSTDLRSAKLDPSGRLMLSQVVPGRYRLVPQLQPTGEFLEIVSVKVNGEPLPDNLIDVPARVGISGLAVVVKRKQ